ncbi:MAG TPA: hypoxanthine phosphoribosyltransferase [Anaerolineales bacterium]
MQGYKEFLDEILITEEALQNRIAELGAQISKDYEGKQPHLICILRGGVMFLSDLIRHLTVPNTIDFMAISSYGVGARQSTGKVRITLDLQEDIIERDVLLVEDIVDSGYTIATVLEFLKTRHPSSLRVCTLLNKAERREIQVPIDYCGFVIPDKFVFGYGLDLDELYRNLPFIGTVNPERYHPPV